MDTDTTDGQTEDTFMVGCQWRTGANDGGASMVGISTDGATFYREVTSDTVLRRPAEQEVRTTWSPERQGPLASQPAFLRSEYSVSPAGGWLNASVDGAIDLPRDENSHSVTVNVKWYTGIRHDCASLATPDPTRAEFPKGRAPRYC